MGAAAKPAKAHSIVTRLTIRPMTSPPRCRAGAHRRASTLRLSQRALGLELALARLNVKLAPEGVKLNI
jgi:hypothetical protein